LVDPSAVNKAKGNFAKVEDPNTTKRVYEKNISSDWWGCAGDTLPEIKHPKQYVCPVSIFIDGAYLIHIGHKEDRQTC
jgi:hypothetical protein